MILIPGKKYGAALILALIVGMYLSNWLSGIQGVVWFLPAIQAFVVVSELRSGVALDSFGAASHRKGCWKYRFFIVGHLVGFSLLVAWALRWRAVTCR